MASLTARFIDRTTEDEAVVTVKVRASLDLFRFSPDECLP